MRDGRSNAPLLIAQDGLERLECVAPCRGHSTRARLSIPGAGKVSGESRVSWVTETHSALRDTRVPRLMSATARRARGLIRNWRLVRERAGWVGMAALIGERGLRPVAFYRRITVITRPAIGDLRPDLEPTRWVSLDPEIERIYAELAAAGNRRSTDSLRRSFGGALPGGTSFGPSV